MRRTEFELCHGEKGYHEMERFALDFPADCPGEAFLFISRFLAMLYIVEKTSAVISLSQVSHVSSTRPERAVAPSPGHRPGYNSNQQRRPVRAKALDIAWIFKAFALTGRQVCVRNNPGRCPGLGATALSGRVELTCES